MTKLRVVLDTNVIISSLFWNGPPREVTLLVVDEVFELVISNPILNEIENKLRDKFVLPEPDIQIAIGTLINHSDIVFPKTEVNAVEADPNDNKILECALEGDADYIITGDKHLLGLNEFRGIKIIKSKDFLDLLESFK